VALRRYRFMLEKIFGRNSHRMVEAAAIRRTEAGIVVEGFTALTLRGDRWFPETVFTWKRIIPASVQR
jgi:hypothetical protein